jgi:hypothetical protein
VLDILFVLCYTIPVRERRRNPKMEDFELYMAHEHFDDEVPDYPETEEDYYNDYDEDWNDLEMGFDPYMGCYSDDC